jgi:hypothetical protein
MDHARLKINKDSAWNISRIIRLIEKNVFAISAFVCRGVWFECAIRRDTVLKAQLLPELRSNLITTLAGLDSYQFSIKGLDNIKNEIMIDVPRHRGGV